MMRPFEPVGAALTRLFPEPEEAAPADMLETLDAIDAKRAAAAPAPPLERAP